jgi:hypothetical protein
MDIVRSKADDLHALVNHPRAKVRQLTGMINGREQATEKDENREQGERTLLVKQPTEVGCYQKTGDEEEGSCKATNRSWLLSKR